MKPTPISNNQFYQPAKLENSIPLQSKSSEETTLVPKYTSSIINQQNKKEWHSTERKQSDKRWPWALLSCLMLNMQNYFNNLLSTIIFSIHPIFTHSCHSHIYHVLHKNVLHIQTNQNKKIMAPQIKQVESLYDLFSKTWMVSTR